jgi:hypothetical protein
MGMGSLFFIIGAILKTRPPPQIIAGQPLPTPHPRFKSDGRHAVHLCLLLLDGLR